MNVSALLTSAGINIAVCVVLFSLYSILRKQPSNVRVFFGRRLSVSQKRISDPFCFDRLFPSASWLVKAWKTKEEDLLAVGGLDSVVLIRLVVFSLRTFSVAACVCLAIVLPVNYHGPTVVNIAAQPLEIFTILNVPEGSKWLWTHCLVLYIITSSACIFLYFEYKHITRLRLAYIAGSSLNPSHFTVVVRAIPWSSQESYCDSVRKFFTKYHASSYLSHQMVYRSGKVQKLMSDAEKVCKILKDASIEQTCKPDLFHCGICRGATDSFKILTNETETVEGKSSLFCKSSGGTKKVCAAAFVFFKTRYYAVVTSKVLQSSNPMLWVTEMAPEPNDVYWSNLWIPYGQLWIRKIAVVLGSIAFMLVFLAPVTLVQYLINLSTLQKNFPFMRGLLHMKYVTMVVTGYLPSVVLILCFYSVPPLMMLFSAVEGCISRSQRKKSACFKVIYFTIWNVFFVNIFTGSIIERLDVFDRMKDIPVQLARAVPQQAQFFMTYVFSSGWASLACELMQIYPLLCNYFRRFILRKEGYNDRLSFPYQTEIPRVLLFGLIGFTCSILVPLILPFLLLYFLLAYFIYRNQILNVYIPEYESGGLYWPMIHNTVIISMVLMQIIALGVFGLRKSPIASGFTIPLLIFTLLFNEYCRHRFHPIFKNHVAEILLDMDQKDEQSGTLEEAHQRLQTAYCQSTFTPDNSCSHEHSDHNEVGDSIQDPENGNPGKEPSQVNPSWNVTFDSAESSEK